MNEVRLMKWFGISKEEYEKVLEEQPEFFELCKELKVAPAEVIRRLERDPLAGALSFICFPRIQRFRLFVAFMIAIMKTATMQREPWMMVAWARLKEALDTIPPSERSLLGVWLPEETLKEWEKWSLPKGLALHDFFLQTDNLISLRDLLFQKYGVQPSPEFKVNCLFLLAYELAEWLEGLIKVGAIVVIKMGGKDETGR